MQESLRELSLPIRWVDPRSLHVTLKFLGETEEEDVKEIESGLAIVLGDQGGGSCDVREIGAFPNLARARILHARVDETTGELGRLARAVEEFTERLGFPPETRSYRPHVTLGRVQGRRRLGPELGEAALRWEGQGFGSFRPTEVVHYESRLGPGGVQYEPIARFPLSPVSSEAGPDCSEAS